MKYKSRKLHSECFKIDAVRQSLESFEPLRVIAKKIGVTESNLWNWRAKYLCPHAEKIEVLQHVKIPEKSQRELETENARLKKMLERANQDIEILKKAEEFFKEKRQKNSNS
jgi:transposase